MFTVMGRRGSEYRKEKVKGYFAVIETMRKWEAEGFTAWLGDSKDMSYNY